MFERNPNSQYAGPVRATTIEFANMALKALEGNRAYIGFRGTGRLEATILWMTYALSNAFGRMEYLEKQNRNYQAIIAELRSKQSNA